MQSDDHAVIAYLITAPTDLDVSCPAYGLGL
jgi:hypothetical protein